MDSVSVYMTVIGAIFSVLGAFVAYMAHRERLRDEAEEADRHASGTAAE